MTEKLIKIAKGAAIAAGGAALTYLTQVATGADFGEWTPIVVAGISVLINVARKLLEHAKEGTNTEAK